MKKGDKVRIKTGALYGQDFSFRHWKKNKTVFTIDEVCEKNLIFLKAKGYGESGHYGNGGIAVYSEDSLEPVGIRVPSMKIPFCIKSEISFRQEDDRDKAEALVALVECKIYTERYRQKINKILEEAVQECINELPY